MKATRIILTVSLALNVLLIAVALKLQTKPSSVSEKQVTKRTVVRTESVAATNNSPPVSTADSVLPFQWSMVESTNYETFVANLRAIDCPAQTIRDIISAELDEVCAQKMAVVLNPLRQQFWQIIANLPANEKMLEEKFEKPEEFIKERDALLEKLIGAGQKDASDASLRREQYDYLSQETYDHLQALQTEYDEKGLRLRKEMQGKSPEEVRQRYQAFQREFETAWKEFEKVRKDLMTPEEYEEFRLRNSQFASIRQNAALIGYSEDDIRALVKVQQDFIDEHPLPNEDGKANREAVRERDAQLKEQVKALLGDQRYADYTRAQDNKFQQIYLVTERYDLPRETAVKVYDIRQTAEAQANQLAGATELSGDERDALLDLLIEQTSKDLTGTLGETAAKSYQQLDGKWLMNLGVNENSDSGQNRQLRKITVGQ